MYRVIDATSQALDNPDPWRAFAGHVRFLAQLQATDRGLADLLITEVTGAPELEELRSRALQDFTRIADRARASGALRADFTPEDLVLLLMANAGLVTGPPVPRQQPGKGSSTSHWTGCTLPYPPGHHSTARPHSTAPSDDQPRPHAGVCLSQGAGS